MGGAVGRKWRCFCLINVDILSAGYGEQDAPNTE